MTAETKIIELKSQEEMNLANQSIFMPVVDKEGKFKLWVKRKMMDYLYNSSPQMKRYLRIHHWAKRKVFQNGIKIFRKIMNKYIIKKDEQIPKEWYNNHLRIFYNSFTIGLKDTWEHMVWKMPAHNQKEYHKKFKNDPEHHFYKEIVGKDHWSFCNRKDIIGIWMAEILEDTFDREWINMTMMRITHEMMEYYGIPEEMRNRVPKPGQYPVYLSKNEHNPLYHLNFAKHPVIGKIWEPKEVIKYGKNSRNKKSNSKCKRSTRSKGKTKGKSK